MHELARRISYVLFILFALPCLYAQTLPCPGEFGVAGEWLFMNAGIDYPYFVQSFENLEDPMDPVNGPSKLIAADQDWHSGYRVELIYSLCNCFNDIRIRWTHFPSFANSADVEGFLFPVQNVVQLVSNLASDVSIHDRYSFYYLDFLLGQKAIQCGCFNLDLQGGIQYSHLSFKEDIQYIFPPDTSSLPGLTEDNFKSHLWGVGIELGAEFNYSFWNCFKLTGRSYATLLINKRTSSRFLMHVSDGGIGDDPVFNAKDQDYWKVSPVANARLGLGYSKCFNPCCLVSNLDIEVGYEAIRLYQGIERIYTLNRAGVNDPTVFDSEGTLRELISFTLHGPYLHAGVSF